MSHPDPGPRPEDPSPDRPPVGARSPVNLERLQERARVPLATLQIAADMLLEDDLEPAERLEHLRAIQRSSARLLGLIDDIAALDRLRLGGHRPVSERVPVFAILQEVTTLMQYRAERKGLRFIFQVDWPFPEFISSNASALRRVLLEVVGNAVHYTERGEVTLRARLMRTGESAGVAFQVEDSGAGMHPHDLERVFQPFERAVERSQLGGEGLGLVMAAELAGALGGELRANSQVGVGTTIDVRIAAGATEDLELLEREPMQIDVGPALPPRRPGPLGATALLIDPDPDLRRALARLLGREGLAVTSVATGVEALERIFPRRERRSCPTEQGGARTGYDIVLLDTELRDRAGDPIALGLRERGFDRRIVGLSSHPLAEVRALFLEAGCDAVLEKPVDRSRLRYVLEQLIGPEAGRGAA